MGLSAWIPVNITAQKPTSGLWSAQWTVSALELASCHMQTTSLQWVHECKPLETKFVPTCLVDCSLRSICRKVFPSSLVQHFLSQVGGFNGRNRLRSAEVYNPLTNAWRELSSMSTGRSNFGIEVISNLLFVVGGFNGLTTICDVEYYNIMTDEWSVACNMEILRSALSCCVVHGLPNMAEYTLSRYARPLWEVEEESAWQSVLLWLFLNCVLMQI